MTQIIIYGAGKRGRSYYGFLKEKKIDNLVAGFCDKKSDEIGALYGKPVFSFDEAAKLNLPFLIGVGPDFFDEIRDLLVKNKMVYYESISDFCRRHLPMSSTEVNRDYCAYYHLEDMDDYFERADSDDRLSFFWDNTPCHKLFSCMNPQNIVELACGRGRHVHRYLPLADHVTLVDVLEKNIEICKKKFKDFSNITYYKNNGRDFSELPNNAYTALFTYDAMVHFELLDIAQYLQETYRILVDGGMALFHHSNNSSDYKASFENAPHGRSFMSKDIFAYLAHRAGLKIVKQTVVDWGIPALDCLTLVSK